MLTVPATASCGLIMLIPGFFLILLVGWIIEKLFIDEVDRTKLARASAGRKKLLEPGMPLLRDLLEKLLERRDLTEAESQELLRELTNPETPPAELIPEEDRWQEVAEGAAREATTMEASDEQTFAEKLVEEGMEDAEQEQMVQAVRESKRKEKS